MKRSLRSETVFYGISKYSNVLVTLLTTAVLSRILSPAEYGVVSVITVFTSFFSILADLGIGTAVIQNKSLTDEETGDIFGFSVCFAIALGGLFCLLGFPIAAFYQDGRYRAICAILSISVLFNAMNIIPNAILMKAKRFRTVGIRLIVVSICTGATAIAMALLGCGYYSLVFQSVIQSALIFLWNFCNAKLRFRVHFRFASIRKVAQFSLYQFSFNFINYFARNLDNLLIGKILGSESLAYYDKGYKLMMYPVQNLTYVINPVLHPILSEHQTHPQYIYEAYMKVVRVLSTLGVLITFVCFWNCREIVLLFFGTQWEKSIPVFQLLSLSVWPQLVSSSAGSVYQSTGNTRLMFRSGCIHFSLSIALIIVGLVFGNLTVIAAMVTAGLYCRFFIDYFFLVKRNFRNSYLRFLGTFRFECCMGIGMLAMIILGGNIHIDNMLLSLIVKVGLLTVVWLVLLVLTGQFRMLKEILRKKTDKQK